MPEVLFLGKKPKQKGKPKNSSPSTGKKGKKVKAGHMRASHILVKKLSIAEEIKEDIDSGADFAKLARQYSECPSKKRGGDLGEFKRGDMVKEFETAVMKLKIGEVSSPVKTVHGYHVIKRTG